MMPHVLTKLHRCSEPWKMRRLECSWTCQPRRPLFACKSDNGSLPARMPTDVQLPTSEVNPGQCDSLKKPRQTLGTVSVCRSSHT